MKTNRWQPEDIKEAAEALKAGEVVAFPFETIIAHDMLYFIYYACNTIVTVLILV